MRAARSRRNSARQNINASETIDHRAGVGGRLVTPVRPVPEARSPILQIMAVLYESKNPAAYSFRPRCGHSLGEGESDLLLNLDETPSRVNTRAQRWPVPRSGPPGTTIPVALSVRDCSRNGARSHPKVLCNRSFPADDIFLKYAIRGL